MNSNRRKNKPLVPKREKARSITANQQLRFMALSSNHDEDLPEESLMARAEWEQTQVDKFWGIDKDLKDRNYEIQFMLKEDRFSASFERYLKLMAQQKVWDTEFVQEEQRRHWYEREGKARDRVTHLKLINSPLSIETILHSIWHLDEEVANKVETRLSLAELSNTMSATTLPPGTELSQTLDPMRMSLHLEGLQRTREIVDNAKGQYRQLLKDLQSNSTAASSSAGINSKPSMASDASPQHPQPSFMTQESTTMSSTSPSKTKRTLLQEVAAQLKLEQPPVLFNEDLEGHPKFLWDQESLLYASFQALDTSGRGYLLKDDLLRVSHDAGVHQYLKFTLFWAVVKKREWAIFEAMLDEVGSSNNNSNNEANSPNVPVPAPQPLAPLHHGHSNKHPPHPLSHSSSTRSNHHFLAPMEKGVSFKSQPSQHFRPHDAITYTMWFETALHKLSREAHVHVKFIRTQSEHEAICKRRGFTTESWSNENYGMIRDFRAMRQHAVGDCVWVLHRQGVRWIPAVIEKIHFLSNNNSSSNSSNQQQASYSNADLDSNASVHSNTSAVDADADKVMDKRSNPYPVYHYDVWYPLNDQELFRSRMATTSKQLLTLPSQTVGQALKPKPYEDERQVCAYAFDLIDANAVGIVELEPMIAAMQSTQMQQILDTSLVLTLVFRIRFIEDDKQANKVIDITSSIISRKGRKIQRKRKKLRQPQKAMPCLLSVLVDTFTGAEEEEAHQHRHEAEEEHKAQPTGDVFLTTHQEEDHNDSSLEKAEGTHNNHRVPSHVTDYLQETEDVAAVSMGCISKTDFLEFCDAVYLMCKFDAERLKPLFIVQ